LVAAITAIKIKAATANLIQESLPIADPIGGWRDLIDVRRDALRQVRRG
jgi:hypothetical protein